MVEEIYNILWNDLQAVLWGEKSQGRVGCRSSYHLSKNFLVHKYLSGYTRNVMLSFLDVEKGNWMAEDKVNFYSSFIKILFCVSYPNLHFIGLLGSYFSFSL